MPDRDLNTLTQDNGNAWSCRIVRESGLYGPEDVVDIVFVEPRTFSEHLR